MLPIPSWTGFLPVLKLVFGKKEFESNPKTGKKTGRGVNLLAGTVALVFFTGISFVMIDNFCRDSLQEEVIYFSGEFGGVLLLSFSYQVVLVGIYIHEGMDVKNAPESLMKTSIMKMLSVLIILAAGIGPGVYFMLFFHNPDKSIRDRCVRSWKIFDKPSD